MPQFSRRDEAAGVLVKVSQALNEIVGRVSRSLLRNGLVDGKDDFEGDAFIGFQLNGELFDVRLGRVLAQSSEALADLLLLDLAITTIVEQVEGLLEF